MSNSKNIRRGISKLVRPPEKISVSESAKRYVKVRTASGGISNWDPELTPYMIEPMNCLSSREYDAVVFIGPAQSGKTQALITCHMAYIIKCDPSDFLIMQTTKGTARDFDTQVIKRAFRDSPELKEELASGSKSDNTYDKVFKSGSILFQRWPSINEISGKPLKFVSMTDYDRMTQNIDGEGSPFTLAQQRTAKFLSRGMTLLETSPGFEVTEIKHSNYSHEAPPCRGGLSIFNMGDMRRWYVKCPECNEYFMPPHDETGLDFIHNRDLLGTTLAETTRHVRYICTKNGCLIDVTHKQSMNKTGIWVPQGCSIENGKITGQRIKTRIASFWFPGIFAAYSNPDALIEKYLKSYREYDITGSEENLKSVINVGFGSCYTPRSLVEANDFGELSQRVESIDRYHVPDDARLLVASVDIQNGKTGRFVVEVHAVGVNMEQWIVDRFDIDFTEKDGTKRRVEPGVYQEDWKLLDDKVVGASYKTSDDKKMVIHLTVIDTGGNGNTTDNAYEYYRYIQKTTLRNKVMLIKGGSNDSKSPVVKSFGKSEKGKQMRDVPLYILNTNSFKDKVDAMLRREYSGGLFLHLPDWLSGSYFDEIRAEVRGDNGKWEKIIERNESLDLCVYILAGCWRLGLNRASFNWKNPPSWAATLPENINVISTNEARTVRNITPPPQPQQTTTNNFINSSAWGSRL